MGKNNLGLEIISAFLEGMTGVDMDELRKGISNSADSVIDEVKEATRSRAQNLSSHTERHTQGAYTRQRQADLYKEREEARKRTLERRHEQEQELRRKKNARASANVAKKTTALGFPLEKVGGTSSVVCMTAGGIGLGVSLLSLFLYLPGVLLGTAALSAPITAGVVAIASLGALRWGISSNRQLSQVQRYAQFVGMKEYIDISELARFAGKSEKKILKDVRKLLKKGFFPQGHLDDENKTLILTDNTYKQYIETKKYSAAREVIDTTAREIKKEYPGLTEAESAELTSMISEGNDYITKLHELNKLIPGEVITNKLNKLEMTLKEIFRRVEEHPEQMPKMHELMDYYLPTMIKLVSAYEEYDKVSDPGKDIVAAKNDIEETLDTINDAFKKLLNNLFKDSVWDVKADAKVLKTVFAQKGLTSDVMSGKEGNNNE